MNQTQARIHAESEYQLLFKQYYEFRLRAYPEMATYDGDHRYDDRLTDLSHAAHQERATKIKGFLTQAQAISVSQLNEDEQLNVELFKYALDIESRAFDTGWHLLNIDQQEGVHLNFPQLIEVQPLQSFNEYEQYFSRLQSFAKQVEDTLENLHLALKKGLSLPRCAVLQSLKQMKHMAEMPLESMPFYLPALKENPELNANLQQRVREMAARIVQESVQPAYLRLYEGIKQNFLPHCHEDTGLHALQGGEAVYDYWLERHTKKGWSAEYIYQRGLNEIVEIEERLTVVLEKLKLPQQIPAVREALSDPRFAFDSVDEMLSAYSQLMETIDTKVPQFFKKLPKTHCILKEIEAWRAEAAPQAYYYPPPQDLSRPGIFYVNCAHLEQRPVYSLGALTLHEAVPGHHLQLARAIEIANMPAFRNTLECTAFVEGWALYAESLGHEMGIYDDPLQELGALSFSLWRAARLVVDTGLHALGWTREQACDYMRQHTLQSEADIQSEVERYLVLPAQALAYKMGEFAIRDLLKYAKTMENNFDLAAFHEQLICEGSLPLETLENRIRAYYAPC